MEKQPRLDVVWFLAVGQKKEDIHSIGSTNYVKSVSINIPAI